MKKNRRMHNIPEDLWLEILSRLPVKSLLRFRCVSKSWKTVIDDPKFCNLHLNHFINNREKTDLFVVQGDEYGSDCVVRCSSSFNQKMGLASMEFGTRRHSLRSYRTFDYPGEWDVSFAMDGLFLVARVYWVMSSPSVDFLLWNPSIRKFRSLPSPPETPDGVTYFDIGLGFDLSNRDYKYVRIACRSHYQFAAVYSISSGSWSTVPIQCKERWGLRKIIIACKSVCAQGHLCFVAWNRESKIDELICFDLSREVFTSVDLPVDNNLSKSYKVKKHLTLFKGKCSLVQFKTALGCPLAPTEVSIWILEISETESEPMRWNMLHTFRTTPGMHRFLYLNSNGEMLAEDDSRLVISYNIETQEYRFLMETSEECELERVLDYIESLVLLK